MSTHPKKIGFLERRLNDIYHDSALVDMYLRYFMAPISHREQTKRINRQVSYIERASGIRTILKKPTIATQTDSKII